MKLPVTYKHRVWHVGFLDQPRFRKHTAWLEGSGLPVSEMPEDWRGIAQLGGAPVWECRPAPRRGVFVDYIDLSKSQRRALSILAVQAGWLAPTILYQAWWYDTEAEDWRYTTRLTRAEAAQQIDVSEEDEYKPTVKTVHGFVATPKFEQFWQDLTGECGPGPENAEEQAHLLVLEAMQKYDGVWWYEDYEPENYSAPRGMLFQSKYHEWTCREAEEVPAEGLWYVDDSSGDVETGVE